jgi:hypothetical protein
MKERKKGRKKGEQNKMEAVRGHCVCKNENTVS